MDPTRVCAEVTIAIPPPQINLNKLIGALFARIDVLERRIAALERKKEESP